MKIDAHQHFWKYSPQSHAWINDEMAVLKRDFMPSDLKPLLDAAGFDGCVAVQASQTEAETQFLLDLAAENPFILGVVGWVDLKAFNVEERLRHFAENPRFCGVRHVLQDEPDDAYMLHPDFVHGISLLRRFGLTYDILIYPKHLSVAAQLVEKFPDQPFVLDHLAKPLIRERIISDWKEGIRELAKHPNVSCKLSGMVTEAAWHTWKPADFQPYLEVALDAFGPDRLLIGSDWPVCLLSADYSQTMQLVQDYMAAFSEEEQAKVLGGNTVRMYGLRE
jgi:L-fuconolactonase